MDLATAVGIAGIIGAGATVIGLYPLFRRKSSNDADGIVIASSSPAQIGENKTVDAPIILDRGKTVVYNTTLDVGEIWECPGTSSPAFQYMSLSRAKNRDGEQIYYADIKLRSRVDHYGKYVGNERGSIFSIPATDSDYFDDDFTISAGNFRKTSVEFFSIGVRTINHHTGRVSVFVASVHRYNFDF